MRWKLILNNQCPKCSSKLFYKQDTELLECALYDIESKVFTCDFSIKPQKLKELKEKIKNKQLLDQYEYQFDLS